MSKTLTLEGDSRSIELAFEKLNTELENESVDDIAPDMLVFYTNIMTSVALGQKNPSLIGFFANIESIIAGVNERRKALNQPSIKSISIKEFAVINKTIRLVVGEEPTGKRNHAYQ